MTGAGATRAEWEQAQFVEMGSDQEAQLVGDHEEETMIKYWDLRCADGCKRRKCWMCAVLNGIAWNPQNIDRLVGDGGESGEGAVLGRPGQLRGVADAGRGLVQAQGGDGQ